MTTKTTATTGDGFLVQQRQCKTCIYRRGLEWDLKKLEADVADPRQRGFFEGYRVCHDAPDRSGVCCRGFWNRHKDHFTLGQLAQRLHFVCFVRVSKDRS